MNTVTSEKMGIQNQKAILEYIRKHGPVSRADINRNIPMSFPAVSANVNALIDNNYIYEIGAGDNSLGRKSTLLEYNARRGYVIGVDIGRIEVTMLISDLQGDILLVSKNSNRSLNTTGKMRKIIKSLLRRSNVAREDVLCVCIGSPGILDVETGKIMFAPFIEDLTREYLEAPFREIIGDVPVLIENSMDCGVTGEKWRGAGDGYENILYVRCGVGVGSSMIINNSLYRGYKRAAGEIGFMVADVKQFREGFSNQGSLEQVISGHTLSELTGEGDAGKAVQKLLEQAGGGDRAAKKTLANVVDLIGMMLINSCSVINPQAVIISGGVGLALYDHAFAKWNGLLRAHIPYPPEIKRSPLYHKANALGAVMFCLQHVNESFGGGNE
jgi:predicted NBD/HSP70 family sugar kinase